MKQEDKSVSKKPYQSFTERAKQILAEIGGDE
jgi:hypothetical protein